MAPNNGGCPIKSYSVYSDLGNGDFTNNLEADDIENDPYKFSHVFSFDNVY